jgi:hypothetical protein
MFIWEEKSMSLRKLTLVLMGAVVILAGTALADNSPAPSGGVSVQAAGSCTAPCVLGPEFTAVGQTVQYSISGASGPLTAAAEDGCIAGDKYELTVKKLLGKPVVGTTSGSQVAGCTCTYSTLVVNDVQLTAKGFGPGKVKLKAVTLPGGVPATAYLAFQQGSITQTVGEDSCL